MVTASVGSPVQVAMTAAQTAGVALVTSHVFLALCCTLTACQPEPEKPAPQKPPVVDPLSIACNQAAGTGYCALSKSREGKATRALVSISERYVDRSWKKYLVRVDDGGRVWLDHNIEIGSLGKGTLEFLTNLADRRGETLAFAQYPKDDLGASDCGVRLQVYARWYPEVNHRLLYRDRHVSLAPTSLELLYFIEQLVQAIAREYPKKMAALQACLPPSSFAMKEAKRKRVGSTKPLPEWDLVCNRQKRTGYCPLKRPLNGISGSHLLSLRSDHWRDMRAEVLVDAQGAVWCDMRVTSKPHWQVGEVQRSTLQSVNALIPMTLDDLFKEGTASGRRIVATKNVVISGGFWRDSEEARALIDFMLALGERADCDRPVLRKIQTDILQRKQAEDLEAIRKRQRAMQRRGASHP